MKTNEKWYAVVNPSSANGRTNNKWPYYYERIRSAGIDLAYKYTSGPGKGIELTRNALEQGYNKIIAVGGDGTVNEVINGLIREDEILHQDLEFAVFGQGTGSDFIRTVKFSSNIDSFIESLTGGCKQKVDVGEVTFRDNSGKVMKRYFINASNIGIGAEVVNQANLHSKAMGSRLTYLSKTMATVFKYKNIDISLLLDKQYDLEGNFCGLIICNGRYIGGGMKIAPEAVVDDGLFDLVVIKDISVFRLLRHFPLIYRGRHTVLPEVDVYRCREISLSCSEQVLLETDGEIPGVSPTSYRILPQCLTARI